MNSDLESRTTIIGKLRLEDEIVAVCIANIDQSYLWKMRDVRLFTYVGGYDPRFSTHNKARDRLEYLTRRRNEANEKALSAHPGAKHILAIDSFYLHRTSEISRLLDAYRTLSVPRECILGASTWYYDQSKVRAVYRFYDFWSTPEMEGKAWRRFRDLPTGLLPVSSVGACYIYPRWVWEKYGYGIPEPFPDSGIFHNWLCKKSGLPVFLDCDVRLWRSHADSPGILEVGLFDRIRRTLRLGHRLNRFVLAPLRESRNP